MVHHWHPPLSYMLGSKSIWLAIFSIQVVFCHDKESEDGVPVTADELAMATVSIESPKIDVRVLGHVSTTKQLAKRTVRSSPLLFDAPLQLPGGDNFW
jgi:hypothetical protein